MSKFYFEIFDKTREEVFGKLSEFKKIGILSGGTAISLQLGGRLSYDFDIFTSKPISRKLLVKVIEVFGKSIQKLADSPSELSFLTPQKIKISFVHFPFPHLYPPVKTKSIFLFNLKDLASNKAYVIGRRGEYRDYVDIFFLLKSGLELRKIAAETEKRFGGAFSERLFLEQLAYFEDLHDFEIDFLKEKYTSEEVLKYLQFKIRNY